MFPSQPLNVLNADQFPEVAERQRMAAENAANGAPSGRGG
jgi:hypothetical protein